MDNERIQTENLQPTYVGKVPRKVQPNFSSFVVEAEDLVRRNDRRINLQAVCNNLYEVSSELV